MKGGLKAVNARVDRLEWKMDGEFKAVLSEIRPPARIVGFRGFSNAFLVKHCAVHGFIAPPPGYHPRVGRVVGVVV